MEHVLIIDDDVELCQLVAKYLTREGFTVEAVHDGTHGIERVLSGEHALVVLDVMLPGLNGFEVLARARAAPGAAASIPIVMLTARGDEVDRIVGLEIGADDYLPKPFNPRELVARIRAILRRMRKDSGDHEQSGRAPAGDESLRLGDIEMDIGARVVRRDDTPVELTAVEFDLLGVLLRSAGRIVTRQELVQSVLDRKLMPFDRSIDTHVSNLRRKLGHQITTKKGVAERIKTVRGVGYIYARSGPTGPRQEEHSEPTHAPGVPAENPPGENPPGENR